MLAGDLVAPLVGTEKVQAGLGHKPLSDRDLYANHVPVRVRIASASPR